MTLRRQGVLLWIPAYAGMTWAGEGMGTGAERPSGVDKRAGHDQYCSEPKFYGGGAMPSGNSISLAIAAGVGLAAWVAVYAVLRGVLGTAVDEAQASTTEDIFGLVANALLELIPLIVPSFFSLVVGASVRKALGGR